MAFLTLENVTHYYFTQAGYTKALEQVSLSIEKGEFVSIIGPSGCGKSTILSIIARLMKQTEGHVKVNNRLADQTDFSIGYMLQQDYLFPWKTILDNILIGPKINRGVTEESVKRARKLLQEVHLEHTENDYPDSLSGGMRQRIALVRTLITDPDILLLDEPFSALDYVTKLKLENIVAKMMRQYNKTTVLVTHDLGEAITMSDTIILMKSSPGRVAKIFTVPKELRDVAPFYVRRHPSYQPLFDEIWHQLNDDEALQVKGLTKREGNH